jgi:hypothetical protein
MKKRTAIFSGLITLILYISAGINSVQAQVFFREHWAVFDKIANNNLNDTRWRVNDAQLSLHSEYGHRTEALANGLMLINVPEDLFALADADLYLEVWGGHPQTANKRFILNGKETYFLPNEGTEADNCAYFYPSIPLKVEQLVNGVNAFQFACDRGKTFWGHFIIDNAAVRCYLKPDHPDLIAAGLKNFSASVQLNNGRTLSELQLLSLVCPVEYFSRIVAVDYFARYLGYDDNGNLEQDDWHGYTQKQQYKNHIGSAEQPPFAVTWDTRWIPTQSKPMAVKALISLKNGFKCWTPVSDGLQFAEKRKRVMLYACTDMPKPFWSRANNENRAVLLLPDDISRVESALLYVRIWDGGEGTINEPFKINDHPYTITSGKAIHDVVFTIAEIDPKHLKSGENIINLLSDTEHHGIEMLLPGPAVLLRFK